MRIIVLLVVALAACAGQSSDDPVMQSPPPSSVAEPAASPGEGKTLTGTFGGDAQLEGGCAWIDDGQTRWEVTYPQGYAVSFDPLTLTGPDGTVAQEGDALTVVGAPQTDVATTCQIGPVWQATEVRVGG